MPSSRTRETIQAEGAPRSARICTAPRGRARRMSAMLVLFGCDWRYVPAARVVYRPEMILKAEYFGACACSKCYNTCYGDIKLGTLAHKNAPQRCRQLPRPRPCPGREPRAASPPRCGSSSIFSALPSACSIGYSQAANPVARRRQLRVGTGSEGSREAQGGDGYG